MHPAVPEPPQDGSWYAAGQENIDIGAFEPGTPFSRWALARYIVGRVILERVSWSLLVVALVLLGLAAVCEWVVGSTFLAVLVAIVALVVLTLRWTLRAVLRRLMGSAAYGPLEDRMRSIVDDASSDVLAEMRRVGLPGRLVTLPLIAVRLVGRRRKETLARMKEFDVDRAVPKARRDELHLVLREATGRPPGGA